VSFFFHFFLTTLHWTFLGPAYDVTLKGQRGNSHFVIRRHQWPTVSNNRCDFSAATRFYKVKANSRFPSRWVRKKVRKWIGSLWEWPIPFSKCNRVAQSGPRTGEPPWGISYYPIGYIHILYLYYSSWRITRCYPHQSSSIRL